MSEKSACVVVVVAVVEIVEVVVVVVLVVEAKTSLKPKPIGRLRGDCIIQGEANIFLKV